jgi:hypothetical protein
MKGNPMPILQVNLRLDRAPSELAPIFQEVAGAIAAVPGMRWKIWLCNEEAKEAGGIYLFDDHAAIDAYLAGPIVASMCTLPGLIEATVKRFDALPELTLATRGPVAATSLRATA